MKSLMPREERVREIVRSHCAGYPAVTEARFVVPDMPGMDLCPDPLLARTSGEYLAELRRYRIWAGQPSYRMACRTGHQFAATTLCAALTGTMLPSLAKVIVIIEGCCGTAEHQQAFATAWRRLSMRPSARK
jgi:hypothetical protein